MTRSISRYLEELNRKLPYDDNIRREIIREVHDHLLSLTQRFRREGLGQREAEIRALEEFGGVNAFVTRFEEQGGPTSAEHPSSRHVAILISAYVGLVVGSAIALVSNQPWLVLLGLAAGIASGPGLLREHRLGPFVGAALGMVVGYIAVAHYLLYSGGYYDQSWSLSGETIRLLSTIFGAMAGAAIGFIPRLRNDPGPLLWATALGLGGHVIARLWLEDYPTRTGLATLATGLVFGTAFGLQKIGRRYVMVPLGAMLAASIGFPLVFFGIPLAEDALGMPILFRVIHPAIALTLVVLIGAALGLIPTAAKRLHR